MSTFLAHTILEMPVFWSSEGLISVNKRFFSRKHDALQIQFEQFLEQILELIVSNFLLQSNREMRIRALKVRFQSKRNSFAPFVVDRRTPFARHFFQQSRICANHPDSGWLAAKSI